MKVTVCLPSLLAIGHSRSITVEARTVGEALDRLDAAAPGLRGHLFDEAGRLRPMVRIALGEQVLAGGDLDTPLHQGDEIVIFQSIAGGRR